MKECYITKEDIELLKEIQSNRNEGLDDNIYISKLTGNVIYFISEKTGLEFEEAAELLIHKGSEAITLLKIDFKTK